MSATPEQLHAAGSAAHDLARVCTGERVQGRSVDEILEQTGDAEWKRRAASADLNARKCPGVHRLGEQERRGSHIRTDCVRRVNADSFDDSWKKVTESARL